LEAGDAEIAATDGRPGFPHPERLVAVAAHRMRAARPEEVLGRDLPARSRGHPAELAEGDQRAAGEEAASRHGDEAHRATIEAHEAAIRRDAPGRARDLGADGVAAPWQDARVEAAQVPRIAEHQRMGVVVD